MNQGFMNGAGRGLYGGLTSKGSRRMPIRPVAQIAGVVVSRWRTLIRAAAGREYILRDVHLVRDRTGVETFSRNVRSRESRKRKQSR